MRSNTLSIGIDICGLSTPAWLLSAGGVNAALDIDFVNNRAYSAGSTSIASLLSCTRSSDNGYYTKADGTLISFPANTLRYGDNGLLVEEQRINYALRSQELDSASWAALNATIAANAAVAPDGTTTAESLTGSGSLVAQRVGQYFGSITGQYTFSIYAKYGSHAYIQILHGGDGAHFANFDIQSGAVGTKGAGATSTITALTNGWYRCTITVTIAVAASLYVYLAPSSSAAYGQASNTTGTVYLWGAQFEAGAFATSYIPTTSGSATRNADNITCVMSNYNAASGAMYMSETHVSSNPVFLGPGQLYVNAGSAAMYDGTNAITQANALSTTATNKVSSTWGTGRLALVQNGGTVASGTAFDGAMYDSTLYLGWNGGGQYLNGYAKRLSIFTTTLSNANMQTLTT